MDNSISGINFNEYIEKHSPGYVIEVFNNNKREEYVVGNRITKPIIEKATSKKPAIFIAVIGIISLLFGGSLQIATSLNPNPQGIQKRDIKENIVVDKKEVIIRVEEGNNHWYIADNYTNEEWNYKNYAA